MTTDESECNDFQYLGNELLGCKRQCDGTIEGRVKSLRKSIIKLIINYHTKFYNG